MTESLLCWVLELLDQIEEPVILHSEAVAFPAGQLEELLKSGILRETSRAESIRRPARFGHGSDLVVRETDRGLYGTADEGEYFDPISLTEDDVRQYEVVLPRLVERFRRENNVVGLGCRRENGLIPAGQKSVSGFGPVDVYLSLPNFSDDSILARCGRFTGIVACRWAAMVTPGALLVSAEDRRILAQNRVVIISLQAGALGAELKVNWEEAFGFTDPDGGIPEPAGKIRFDSAEPNLERLIAGQRHVTVPTAARYLQRTIGHVRRLAQKGKLDRVGQGRPIQVTTDSLRKYKGA